MKSLLAALPLLCLLSLNAKALEIVQWQRLPIAVLLQVGQERIIFVDRNVRVGMPRSLKNQLRVQSNSGALYLRANGLIEPTRLQLQDVSNGEIILLDIAATEVPSDTPALEPLKIVKAAPVEPDATQPGDTQEQRPAQTPVPVVLTRYAAQNLYAPLRTVEPLYGVTQARVDRHLSLHSLLPTLPVQASVLGAWQLDDFQVTAVRLQNRSSSALQLDPRLLQGDFIAATFQHRSLDVQGTAADSTALYLITRGHDLAQALLPAMSPIDATSNLPNPRERAHEK
ncbi:TIGR03749 family integrating conjugative element protein [Pseudomonas sp. LJDD11]|uniref:TIGR03749 family integrating conjugative element protein n=1 Tax=Pseudomonas sp. LJDD11 TaxID=2931984 RepID=UPI00211C4018|nr:TIGR03749 family integrating conjugative element protein [Pseudomonas sp. LJDD11]MCQ9422319.1 TIGR03749 family integrating conjugative element protein [Pseudomonas sp. LJDD11]